MEIYLDVRPRPGTLSYELYRRAKPDQVTAEYQSGIKTSVPGTSTRASSIASMISGM